MINDPILDGLVVMLLIIGIGAVLYVMIEHWKQAPSESSPKISKSEEESEPLS